MFRCASLMLLSLLVSASSTMQADEMLKIVTPTGSVTGTCQSPPTCEFGGLNPPNTVGTDTAIFAEGSFGMGLVGNFKTSGINVAVRAEAGFDPETITVTYSLDDSVLPSGPGYTWVEATYAPILFRAANGTLPSGTLQTYIGATLGAETTLLGTLDFDFLTLSTNSQTPFEFPNSYAITEVLTLNLPATGHSPNLNDSGNSFEAEFVIAPEPSSWFLLGTVVVAVFASLSRMPRPKSVAQRGAR